LIGILDVDYKGEKARAACVLIESWDSGQSVATYTSDIGSVAAYEPGNFYRRELPCLLSVLSWVPNELEVILVDGYVWLSPEGELGLGAHLYTAINRTPIIGVAKTAFKGMRENALVTQVFRGGSRNPLFVTSIGYELEAASHHILSMAGNHRIPEMIKATDHLARGMN